MDIYVTSTKVRNIYLRMRKACGLLKHVICPRLPFPLLLNKYTYLSANNSWNWYVAKFSLVSNLYLKFNSQKGKKLTAIYKKDCLTSEVFETSRTTFQNLLSKYIHVVHKAKCLVLVLFCNVLTFEWNKYIYGYHDFKQKL